MTTALPTHPATPLPTPRPPALRLALLAVLLAPSLALAGPPGAPPPAPAEPELGTPPVLVQLAQAEVPPGTAFPAAEVLVVVAVDVAADGRVGAVRLEAGAGEPFDAAAVAAAGKSLFQPGRLTTGEAVPVTVTLRIHITAPAPPPPTPPPPAPVRLSGRLLERGTRRPLADVPVAVRLGNEWTRTTTSADGRFTVVSPEPRFVVVAIPPGHDRLEASILAQPGEERDETYYLEQSGDPNQTVVSASPVRREITRQVIPAEEVARLPGTQGDTLKAVLDLPGVARAPFGSGLLILRGSAPGDSRYFVEGQEIPLLYHFGGLRSTIAPRFLESIEFVPGNFAPDFGRATGGIVEVRLRDPASDMFRGDATVDFYDAGVSLEGPLGAGWAGGFAFRRSWIDTLLPLVLPSNGNFTFETAPRFYDYQFLATRPLGAQKLRLLYYGSLDTLAVLLKRPSDDPKITGTVSTRTMFHALQASLGGEVAPGLRQETSLQLSYEQFRVQVGPQYFFNLDVRSAGLRSTWTWELARGLQLRSGLDAILSRARISLDLPRLSGNGQNDTPSGASGTQTLATTEGEQEPGAFAEARWEPVAGLLVLPGVRFDWYSEIREWTFDPRLGARWEVVPGTTLKAGLGLFHQPPRPQESSPQLGNPRLLAPSALQASLGVEQRLVTGLDGELTGFHKWLGDQVVSNPASAYDASQPPYTNQGTGRVYGLEATLRARFGDWFFGWIAYTFQRSFRTDGPGKPEQPFTWDQPHLLTVVGSWTINRQWGVGGRFRYTSGNPTTPVTGSVLDANSGAYVPLYGAVNSDRLPPFNALDLRVDRTWTYPTWKLDLYLDVQNVYNRGNVEGYSYSYDYSQKSPLTGLPILPILGIQGEW